MNKVAWRAHEQAVALSVLPLEVSSPGNRNLKRELEPGIASSFEGVPRSWCKYRTNSHMKVLVPVKRVVDSNVKIRDKPDGSGVDLANVKMSLNPFDEISVEEALRLKEGGRAKEVVVVSIGPAKSKDTLRTALAMGADRVILVETEDAIEPLAVAKILKGSADAEKPGLIIVGNGQMLAALLRCAQATFASKCEMGDGRATVTREIDGGLQMIEVALPAVVTTDLRLNEPRYASLPKIMKAKKRLIDKKSQADFGGETTPRLKVPEDRRTGRSQGGRQSRFGRRACLQAEDRSRRSLVRRCQPGSYRGYSSSS